MDDNLGKGEVLTNTDLGTIFERNMPFADIEKVLDLLFQLMKNGAKTSVSFIILFSVHYGSLFLQQDIKIKEVIATSLNCDINSKF